MGPDVFRAMLASAKAAPGLEALTVFACLCVAFAREAQAEIDRRMGTAVAVTRTPEKASQPSDVDASQCLTMVYAAETYFPKDDKAENMLREAGRRGDAGDPKGLPVVHVGRYVYVRKVTLERWIASRESKH